ncbi:hypothetical protein SETIT_7G118400v2 [Setaria italica]|uniref:Uncharacterized protein n=1 Tax=Setaria italica TaxID=4555 RepID=A0A368RUV5_SETIT|nr:hypothetical protein SETIT_7G118400v2 [Setaria italica]
MFIITTARTEKIHQCEDGKEAGSKTTARGRSIKKHIRRGVSGPLGHLEGVDGRGDGDGGEGEGGAEAGGAVGGGGGRRGLGGGAGGRRVGGGRGRGGHRGLGRRRGRGRRVGGATGAGVGGAIAGGGVAGVGGAALGAAAGAPLGACAVAETARRASTESTARSFVPLARFSACLGCAPVRSSSWEGMRVGVWGGEEDVRRRGAYKVAAFAARPPPGAVRPLCRCAVQDSADAAAPACQHDCLARLELHY